MGWSPTAGCDSLTWSARQKATDPETRLLENQIRRDFRQKLDPQPSPTISLLLSCLIVLCPQISRIMANSFLQEAYVSGHLGATSGIACRCQTSINNQLITGSTMAGLVVPWLGVKVLHLHDWLRRRCNHFHHIHLGGGVGAPHWRQILEVFGKMKRGNHHRE